jgi:hypothetical protein
MQNGMGKPKGIEAKDSSGGMLQYRKYWEGIQFYFVGAGWWFGGEGLSPGQAKNIPTRLTNHHSGGF